VIGETHTPGDLTDQARSDRDDVLYTGRTVRAGARTSWPNFGRPKRISLCVLVDSGGREAAHSGPISWAKSSRPDRDERVDVQVE